MARRETHGKLKLSLSQDDDAPARGVGATLRDARLRRGWSIEDCSQNLRIRSAVLEAMEAGHFERLPNGAYALGFVRSYADFLGLDRDEIARRVKAEAAALSTKTELVFPTPIAESRLPSGVILLVSAILAAGAYGIWYYQTASDRAPIPRVAAVSEQAAPVVAPAPAAPPPASGSPNAASAPAEVAASGTAPPANAPSGPVPSAPAAAVDASPESRPADPPAAAAPAPQVVAAPPPSGLGSAVAATTPESAAAPRQYGEASAGRIVIKATGDSWVQVREPAGSIVFSRILRAGESYNVPNQSGYLLATGSAGVLDIMVDGKKAPSIGRPGFVRKDVPLDPERLLAGTAVPPEVVRPAAPAAAPPADPASGNPAVAPAPASPATPPSGG